MDNKRFLGKTAIVTGAALGIGFEMARQLCEQGAAVILNDIDPKLCQESVEKIKKYGHCLGFPGDVADPAFNKELVQFAFSETNTLDIVMANAGITLFGDFLNYPHADFKRVIDVNLGGAFFLAQQASKIFIAQQKKGTIVFTSSVTGHQAHKDLAAYGMTKAAIEMLAKHLVLELSPYKINVNVVAPGATLTDRTLEDPSYTKAWADITPIGSAALPKDIAHAALFLASEEASHITGQTIVVDGGWSVVSPTPF